MSLISNFSIPIICKTKKITKKYIDKFTKNKIEVRPIIAGNIGRQPFFKKYNLSKKVNKNTDFIHKNGFYFGNNSEISTKDLKMARDLL